MTGSEGGFGDEKPEGRGNFFDALPRHWGTSIGCLRDLERHGQWLSQSLHGTPAVLKKKSRSALDVKESKGWTCPYKAGSSVTVSRLSR